MNSGFSYEERQTYHEKRLKREYGDRVRLAHGRVRVDPIITHYDEEDLFDKRFVSSWRSDGIHTIISLRPQEYDEYHKTKEKVEKYRQRLVDAKLREWDSRPQKMYRLSYEATYYNGESCDGYYTLEASCEEHACHKFYATYIGNGAVIYGITKGPNEIKETEEN